MIPTEVAYELLNVPKEHIPALVAALLARLVEPVPEANGALPDEDPLLTTDQVAERLQVDRKWVYRHKDKLGAVALSRKQLRFPSSGVDAYLRRRKAASSARRR
jgi:excisionase family DNA binding protein